MHEDLTLTVRQSKHSYNICRGADPVKVFGLWNFYIGIALDDKSHRHLLANRLLDSVARIGRSLDGRADRPVSRSLAPQRSSY